MNRIILQPAGNGDARAHYVDTIENLVSQDSMSTLLDKGIRERLRQIYGDNPVPVWGVTPGKNDVNVKKWDKINIGDVTLFSRNGGIYSSGVVTQKLNNRELALNLWGQNQDGQTWEYIYFLDEIKGHQIAYREFNNIVGYSPNYIIQGFNVLAEEKSLRVFEGFDLSSEIYLPHVDEKQYQETIIKLEEKPLDIERKSKARMEQAFLRKYLFGNGKLGHCSICGEEFPVGFLVAAHIKKRSHCSTDEKLDYKNVVAPMCKFGCDDLFEKGNIFIENGLVRINKNKLATNFMSVYLEKIKDKKITHWNQVTKEYFDWHYNYHLS